MTTNPLVELARAVTANDSPYRPGAGWSWVDVDDQGVHLYLHTTGRHAVRAPGKAARWVARDQDTSGHDSADRSAQGGQMKYPGTETGVDVGDHVACTRGPREIHDYGTVQAVDTDADAPTVTVHWRASEQVVTHPLETLRQVDVYTSFEDARDAYIAAAGA